MLEIHLNDNKYKLRYKVQYSSYNMNPSQLTSIKAK